MITGLGTLAGLLATGCGTIRSGNDSAPYQVLRRDGKFELREYPALAVVQTPMRGSGDSFRRLFRFISGGNVAKQKIAMTTPVFMSGSDTNATMAFVMPATMQTDPVPKPFDGAVAVKVVEAGHFAVLRYSGGRGPKKVSESAERLRAWLRAEGLKEMSPPVYGYFDPPWTPSFLRRNEVMLRTEGGK